MGLVGVGSEREQPQGEVLSANHQRQERTECSGTAVAQDEHVQRALQDLSRVGWSVHHQEQRLHSNDYGNGSYSTRMAMGSGLFAPVCRHPLERNLNDKYRTLCNPFEYAADILTNPAQRAAHIAGPGVSHPGAVCCLGMELRNRRACPKGDPGVGSILRLRPPIAGRRKLDRRASSSVFNRSRIYLPLTFRSSA